MQPFKKWAIELNKLLSSDGATSGLLAVLMISLGQIRIIYKRIVLLQNSLVSVDKSKVHCISNYINSVQLWTAKVWVLPGHQDEVEDVKSFRNYTKTHHKASLVFVFLVLANQSVCAASPGHSHCLCLRFFFFLNIHFSPLVIFFYTNLYRTYQFAAGLGTLSSLLSYSLVWNYVRPGFQDDEPLWH